MEEEPPPCHYCGKDISQSSWVSSWHDNNRYESLKCSCGKVNWRSVVEGSGHILSRSPLESMVRVVCAFGCSKQ